MRISWTPATTITPNAMSDSPAPVAGPSPPRRFFVDPFKVTDYQPPPNSSSRSGTPLYLPGRFRSVSLARTEREEDANESRLRNARHHSVLRLKSAWDLLLEKYGNVQLQDDDEVDLFTGRIVKDRGRLKALQRLEFGDSLEAERAEESFLGSEGPSEPAFDSDEDELVGWDDRSGLDLQMPEPEEEYAPPPRTREDEEDLRAFLRAEADRKAASEDEEESQHDSSDDERGFTRSSTSSSRGWSPRSHGTRITVDLEGLAFDGASREDSEDELLQRTSDAEDAVRTDPVGPDSESDFDSVSIVRRYDVLFTIKLIQLRVRGISVDLNWNLKSYYPLELGQRPPSHHGTEPIRSLPPPVYLLANGRSLQPCIPDRDCSNLSSPLLHLKLIVRPQSHCTLLLYLNFILRP